MVQSKESSCVERISEGAVQAASRPLTLPVLQVLKGYHVCRGFCTGVRSPSSQAELECLLVLIKRCATLRQADGMLTWTGVCAVLGKAARAARQHLGVLRARVHAVKRKVCKENRPWKHRARAARGAH